MEPDSLPFHQGIGYCYDIISQKYAESQPPVVITIIDPSKDMLGILSKANFMLITGSAMKINKPHASGRRDQRNDLFRVDPPNKPAEL
jgi:hypothetical protein